MVGRTFIRDLAQAKGDEARLAPRLALALGHDPSRVVHCVTTTDMAGVDLFIGTVRYDLKVNYSRYGTLDNPELRIETQLQYRQATCDYYCHVFPSDNPDRFYLVRAPDLHSMVSRLVRDYPTYWSHSSRTPFVPVPVATLAALLPPGAVMVVTVP